MQFLKESQEKEAIRWMDKAAEMARKALCLNAKCGTVIVKDDEIIGEGYNAPPLDKEENRTCDKDFGPGKPKYDKTCCMHAEWRAIMDALKKNPEKVSGSKLYFVRVDEAGEIKRSGQPYCTVCSRMALDAGIEKFVLWHEEGIGEYSTDEYNRLSCGYIPEKKERFKITPAVYLVLIKDNKILLSRRYNTGFHDGDYSLPAGHLDGNEPLLQAMIREADEEIGIKLSPENLELVHAIHRKMPTEERVSFFFRADDWEGEPKIMEPEKCDGLDWFDLDNLPDNLIPYVRQAIDNLKENKSYSEDGWQ
jgi:ADP-ribose pyrophosphatase YjhB (NUDIX family)/deoxycytidylate deaminase